MQEVRNYYEDSHNKESIRTIYNTGNNLRAKNGNHILNEYFNHVELLIYDAGFKVTEPEPVLQYYMATQLYQGPFNNENIDRKVREEIASTFLKLTEEMIQSSGGQLIISKPVAAFICKV